MLDRDTGDEDRCCSTPCPGRARHDVDPDLQTSFRAFAELCVTRQIITAIKTATRQKHGPLNDHVSFSRPVVGEDDGERQIADLLPTLAVRDPADLVTSVERIRALQAHVDDVLSDLGTEVLRICVSRRWPTPRNLPDMLEPTAPPQGGLGRTASTTAPTPSAGGPPASSH